MSDGRLHGPAGAAVERRDPEPIRRFLRLRDAFADLYLAAREHGAPELVEPGWRVRNAALESALLPCPRLGFIRHPAILYSMFVGERYLQPELRLLTAAIEGGRLARLLAEDPVGGPPLVRGHDGTYLTSANRIHHLHHLIRFGRETGVDPARLERVVEWGGGYGSLARVFMRLSPASAYVVVDTPLFATLQWLYLASVLGPDRVALRLNEPVAPESRKVTVVPVGLFECVPADANLFISTWALNESAAAAQEAIAAGRWFGANHLLMGMHTGVPLADRARADGARVVPVGEIMPSQNYVLR